MVETVDRFTKDGLRITSSEIRRLETTLKQLKESYDSLKIRQLTKQGVENDQAKLKQDQTTLENLRKEIQKKEAAILEIKLDLK